MRKEIGPEVFSAFEQPIEEALSGYVEVSEGYLGFDVEKAKRLELTPEKRYSAKSESEIEVRAQGQETKLAKAKLVTVLFMPRDDTGASYGVSFGMEGDNPKAINNLPRSKQGTHSEAHLTIASYKPDYHLFPRLFAGNLSVLTPIPFRPEAIEEGFEVGQNKGEFVASMCSDNSPKPKASLTVGQNERGKRFGDPHAIFNGWKDIAQVAGFIAVNEDEAEIIEVLKAGKPHGLAMVA
ncbi:hypothetical protein HZB74_02415 [Candidatus Saccharibacteria bacterium]|nr:hypothetical protein [Candidatus Saccharibacteria bacterium]